MKVLAVGAHPDDLEMSCGGTLARFVQRGDIVTMAHLARGDAGTFHHTSDEIAAIRDSEARKAAMVIGAEYLALKIPDGRVNAADEGQRSATVELIRIAQPDVVITHAVNDYMSDHNETGKLVFDAGFTASLPNYRTATQAHQVVPMFYRMETYAGVNFVPTEYVDISEMLEIKREALSAHASQLKWIREHDDVDLLEQMEVTARYRGIQCGVQYAEGFAAHLTALRAAPRRLLP